jgi:hypothetical protein
VGAGEEEALGEGDELVVAHLLGQLVHGHGGDQLLVADGLAAGEGHGVGVGVDLLDLALLAEQGLLLGQGVGHGDPDASSAIAGGESEGGIGAPVAGDLVEDQVADGVLDIGSGDTLSEPLALHLRFLSARVTQWRTNLRLDLHLHTLVVGTAQTL